MDPLIRLLLVDPRPIGGRAGRMRGSGRGTVAPVASGSTTRRLVLRVALIGLLGGTSAACFARPSWIHELPARGPGTSAEQTETLAGTYIRRVESRYSVANRAVGWQGREWIEIEAGGTGYRKVHLYVEQSLARVLRVAYEERGRLAKSGDWLLLEPKSAYLLREQHTSPGEARAALPFPTEARERGKAVDVPALAFHVHPRRRILTPLTFERFGELFEHGIHEGCRGAHLAEGEPFWKYWREYNEKSFHRHGYFPSPRAPDQAPRKRNVLLPKRMLSPSWSARGRSSLWSLM